MINFRELERSNSGSSKAIRILEWGPNLSKYSILGKSSETLCKINYLLSEQMKSASNIFASSALNYPSKWNCLLQASWKIAIGFLSSPFIFKGVIKILSCISLDILKMCCDSESHWFALMFHLSWICISREGTYLGRTQICKFLICP